MKSCIAIIILALSSSVHAQDVNCESPNTTIDINICSSKEAEDAHAELELYLSKVIEKYSSEKKAMEAMRKSQAAWLAYREAYCGAIYELWSGGTIRGAMHNGCLLELTKQRTHTIWKDYLTYPDSTEPDLPEPQ